MDYSQCVDSCSCRQSLFAIEYGGSDSGTVVGCSELIQAAIAASSMKMAGYVSEYYGWRYVWAVIVVAASCGTLSMMLYQSNVSHKATDDKGAPFFPQFHRQSSFAPILEGKNIGKKDELSPLLESRKQVEGKKKGM